MRGNGLFCRHTNTKESSRISVPLLSALVSFWLTLSLLSNPILLEAQLATTAENRAKANFLAKVPSFVQWQEEALPSGPARGIRPWHGRSRKACRNSWRAHGAGITFMSHSVRESVRAEKIRPRAGLPTWTKCPHYWRNTRVSGRWRDCESLRERGNDSI